MDENGKNMVENTNKSERGCDMLILPINIKWEGNLMKKCKRPAATCLAAILTAGMMPWAGGAVVSRAADNGFVQNGGFESGNLNGWTENMWCVGGGAVSTVVQADGNITPTEGSRFLKQEGKGNGAQILQSPSLTAGDTYWLTADIYQETAKSLSVGFMENEGKGEDPKFQTQDETTTGKWKEKAIRFTMWEGAKKPQLYTWLNAGATGYVDNIQITKAADYSALEASVNDGKNKAAMTDYYTEESINALKPVLEQAEAMTNIYDSANADDTQGEVDKMNTSLQEKIGDLKVQQGVGEIEGTTAYYIDAENGNDSNEGTSGLEDI